MGELRQVSRTVLRLSDGSEVTVRDTTPDDLLERICASYDIAARSAAVKCASFRAPSGNVWRDKVVHIGKHQIVAAFQISDGFVTDA